MDDRNTDINSKPFQQLTRGEIQLGVKKLAVRRKDIVAEGLSEQNKDDEFVSVKDLHLIQRMACYAGYNKAAHSKGASLTSNAARVGRSNWAKDLFKY